ncbi:MAG: hypothetical protein AB7F59_06705 [Bdellovibrionales bacterium]
MKMILISILLLSMTQVAQATTSKKAVVRCPLINMEFFIDLERLSIFTRCIEQQQLRCRLAGGTQDISIMNVDQKRGWEKLYFTDDFKTLPFQFIDIWEAADGNAALIGTIRFRNSEHGQGIEPRTSIGIFKGEEKENASALCSYRLN